MENSDRSIVCLRSIVQFKVLSVEAQKSHLHLVTESWNHQEYALLDTLELLVLCCGALPQALNR